MLLLLMMGLSSISNAIQPDAEYRVLEKQFGEQWVADDKRIQGKLAALGGSVLLSQDGVC